MSSPENIRVLAVASIINRSILHEKLAPYDRGLVCVATIEEIAELRRRGERFEVILLPERLSKLDWWQLWSELNLLDPKPSIIVYSRNPTFRLWTSVLDLGGFGVVSEPFDEQEIRQLLYEAAFEFNSRSRI